MRVLLVVATVVAASAVNARPQSDNTVVPVTGGNDCLSEACVAASHRLFTSMNRTADPCVDFNEFACGRFVAEAHIPDDKGRWDASFSPITEEIYLRGRALMEEQSKDDDFEAYRKARVFYRACVDEDHLEALGVEPLKKVLKDVGGWPVVEGDAWQGKDTYNWYDAVAKLGQIGFGKDFFVTLAVSTDDKNSLARVIFMDQPDLGIDREYLVKGFEDPDIQSYFRYMNDTAVLLGADPAKSQADLKSALLLEIALANASAPREERRNSSLMYNPFILGELERVDGHPPSWTDYVASILEPAVEITDKERVIVQNPAYLKKMAPILLAADRRTLANYVGWRAAVSAMSHLNREAKDIKQRYDKAIHGTNERTPTWKKCVREVGFNSFSGASFGIGISSMYVKRFFPAEAKTSMVNMINYLRKGFSSILDNIDWMDVTTRGKAHEKLDQMIQFIAYPDELLDKSKVDGMFATVDIQEGDYLGNVLKLIKWWREFTYKRLRQPVDKKDWVDHSFVALVNAFYNPSVNSIEFPAGILQGAFFDHRVPAYLNFGGIGGVIGHEITHGFDDQGRQYDGEGNLRDWWDPSTNDNFVKRAQCIVEQYGNYSVKQVDLNLNGINTQGENIADNGGIKEAYLGYDNWVKDNGEEKALPGLGYTPRQLFWINWGQVWCSKYRDAAMKNQVQTGAHSPGSFRIIGPLSNSADFARDFNCPKNTAMNPDNKCTVW